MRVDRRFPRQVVWTLVVAAVLLAWPLWAAGSPAVVTAVVLGAAMSTINVLLGYLAIEYAYDKSYTTFLKAVLGGMGLRLLGMLGAMVLLITVVGVHAVALTVSVLGFYAVYLVLEILFIQKKVVSRQQG